MTPKLTIDALFSVYKMTCDREGDEPQDWVIIESVQKTLRYSQTRLARCRPQILALLAELPTEFRSVHLGGGGGWTFLNACIDVHGRHWGEHAHVDLLISLGLAIEAVQFGLPREYWPALPGGLPYFEVKTLE